LVEYEALGVWYGKASNPRWIAVVRPITPADEPEERPVEFDPFFENLSPAMVSSCSVHHDGADHHMAPAAPLLTPIPARLLHTIGAAMAFIALRHQSCAAHG
jgi:hypothetical protein